MSTAHIGDKTTIKGIDFVVTEINFNRLTGACELTLEQVTAFPATEHKMITEVAQ